MALTLNLAPWRRILIHSTKERPIVKWSIAHHNDLQHDMQHWLQSSMECTQHIVPWHSMGVMVHMGTAYHAGHEKISMVWYGLVCHVMPWFAYYGGVEYGMVWASTPPYCSAPWPGIPPVHNMVGR